MKAFDRGEMIDMSRQPTRIEIGETIIRMYEHGKTQKEIYAYLGELGYRNPQSAYQDIRKLMREKRPDLLEKFPVRTREKQDQAPEEMPPVKLTGPVKIPEDRQGKISMIDGIEPLEPASLWSRVLDGGTFVKVDGGMMLRGPNYQIILNAYQWFKLTEEILVSIRQLKADRPGGMAQDDD